MTLPNRINYTPGEKRRERKHHISDAMPHQGTSQPTHGSSTAVKKTASTAVTSAATTGGDGWRDELIQLLTGMASNGTTPHLSQDAEYHLKMLAEHKAKAEAARQRLYADPCFQEIARKEELMGFTELLEKNSTADPDPLEQMLTGIASEAGLARGQTPTRLDPQWTALFQQAGSERQQLISRLDKVDNAVHSSNIDTAMDVVCDPPVRAKYKRTMLNLHELTKNRLYQHLRSSLFSRAASRAPPLSPSDSPLRQPPKKRTNLSKHAKNILREWFEEHLHHPYPTEEEKEWLSEQGGITIEQVNNWFINTRGRKWKPMLARIIKDKQLGVESKLFDSLVEKIEEPYRLN